MCIFDQKHVCSQRQVPEWAMWRKGSPETATLLPPPSVLSAPRGQKQDSFDPFGSSFAGAYRDLLWSSPSSMCVRMWLLSTSVSAHVRSTPSSPHAQASVWAGCVLWAQKPSLWHSACVTDVPNWSQCKSISLGYLGCRNKCVSDP